MIRGQQCPTVFQHGDLSWSLPLVQFCLLLYKQLTVIPCLQTVQSERFSLCSAAYDQRRSPQDGACPENVAKRSREVQSPDIAAHFFLENSYVVTVESFDDRQFFSPVTIQVPELNITSGDIQQLLRDHCPFCRTVRKQPSVPPKYSSS